MATTPCHKSSSVSSYLSQFADGKRRAVARRHGHDPPPPQRRRAPRHAQVGEGTGPLVFLRIDVIVLIVGQKLVSVKVLDRAFIPLRSRRVTLREVVRDDELGAGDRGGGGERGEGSG